MSNGHYLHLVCPSTIIGINGKPCIQHTTKNLLPFQRKAGLRSILFISNHKCVAIDAEMIETTDSCNCLARLSVVDELGEILLDKFVKPVGKVINLRTWVSGVRTSNLKTSEPFEKVRAEAIKLMENKIVIGHSVVHDFKSLNYEHPRQSIRDVSIFPMYMSQAKTKQSLKTLAYKFLGLSIQEGSHSSVDDAQATMKLYKKVEYDIEKIIENKKQIQPLRGKKMKSFEQISFARKRLFSDLAKHDK